MDTQPPTGIIIASLLPQGRNPEETERISTAYREWLDWNTLMEQARNDQGSTRYTRRDYDERYPQGDGIPSDFSGNPYEPLERFPSNQQQQEQDLP